ncbi:hypothetical protein TKK_0006943 [Trichogramma kaykai]|uniref:Enoyl-CoA delta isomerase 1, mitochondrial n=1 Tax=Trichogramma kaykai TaxID=54128 RepID=A0ABD2XB01_9HYME
MANSKQVESSLMSMIRMATRSMSVSDSAAAAAAASSSSAANLSKDESHSLVDVSYDQQTGISTLRMRSAPVNSLSVDMCRALKAALDRVMVKGSTGLILTSSLARLFSAGFDLKAMHEPDVEHLRESWHALQDLWLSLYAMRIPTVAAINGACPGGGCLLALACDYRVMLSGEHTIGVVGAKLGLATPKWFNDSMIAVVGYRQAELALMRATLFKPEEALRIGLIDEIASDEADALLRCTRYIKSYDHILPEARADMKLTLRRPAIEWLESNRQLDTESFIKSVQRPYVQKIIGDFLRSRRRSAL